MLAAGGLYSDTLIARADQWWNKSLSMENPAFARYLNGREHPLLISSDGDVNPGELLSLSYLLDPKVRILLAPASGEVTIPPGFTELFALNPSFELRQRLAQDYQLRPYRDSWKLWVLTPRSAAAPE